MSSLVLWASHAPLQQAWLAWLAPVGYLWFAEQKLNTNQSFTRRDWLHGWLAGCVFWLPILQGIRLAFWPLYAGWLALALYLAVYTPLFLVGIRNLRQRRIPLFIAAPLLWVGLEYLRSYILTGYSASMLAHTQAYQPWMIQSADMLGAYGVSWILMTAAVALYQLTQWVFASRAEKEIASETTATSTLVSLAFTIVLVLLNLTYGSGKLAEAQRLQDDADFKVLLVQENTPSMFDTTTTQSLQDAWNSYLELTVKQVQRHGQVDLIVWPESTFTGTLPWYDPNLPSRLPPELLEQGVDQPMLEEGTLTSNLKFQDKCRQVLGSVASVATNEDPAQVPYLLAGCDVMGVTEQSLVHYNSGLLIDRTAQVVDDYRKMHLVVFGEFLPWGFEWLGDSFGFWGAEPGQSPKCFRLGEIRVAPNICFESMMPRVIQSQVSELSKAGQAPDVLVNLTNDSWFRGSSMLDHHLACTILCAVENRRPILVAANTGISAEVSGSGELLQKIERFEVDGILASPKRDSRWGLVQEFGYPLGWLGSLIALLSWWPKRKVPVSAAA